MYKKTLITIILIIPIILAGYMIYLTLPPGHTGSNNDLTKPNLTDNGTFKENSLNIPKTLIISPSGGGDSSQPQPHHPKSIKEVIKKLDDYIREVFPGTGIPGAAVAVVYKDKIVYLKTLGVKKVGETDPIDVNTIFQIGSLSKSFTSAAIAAQVDEGIMGWDDLARQYYGPDEFLIQDPVAYYNVAIRDLLSHRSGMYENAGNEHVIDFMYNFPYTLHKMRYIGPQSEFRTKFGYNNIMYSLAGQCSARASGKDWAEVLEEELLTPLGLDSTLPYYDDFINSPNHSGTHIIIDGVIYYADPINLDAMGPAGSISSSIRDMADWLRFQLNEGGLDGRQVVSSPSLIETHTPHILVASSPTVKVWYGLGWGIRDQEGRRYIEHSGSTRLSTCYMSFLPSERLGVVVLANEGSRGITFGQMVALTLYDLYFQSSNPDNFSGLIDGLGDYQTPVTPPATSNIPPLPLENYAGNYYSDYYGKIQLVVNGTDLALYPGNNPEPTPLIYVSGNTFLDYYTNQEVIFKDIVDNTPREVLTLRWEVNGANGTFHRI